MDSLVKCRTLVDAFVTWTNCLQQRTCDLYKLLWQCLLWILEYRIAPMLGPGIEVQLNQMLWPSQVPRALAFDYCQVRIDQATSVRWKSHLLCRHRFWIHIGFPWSCLLLPLLSILLAESVQTPRWLTNDSLSLDDAQMTLSDSLFRDSQFKEETPVTGQGDTILKFSSVENLAIR